MTAMVRSLIFSHVVVFAGGFYLGKSMDADELSLYRDAHESTVSKLRRKAGTAAIGVAVLGTAVLMLRLTVGAGSSSSSQKTIAA